MIGQDVVIKGREYLNVAWRHQGRSPITGLDCAGLIIQVGLDLNLLVEDYNYTNYGREPDGKLFIAEFNRRLNRVVNLNKRQEGDVLIFRQGAYPAHCGFFSIKNGVEYLLHSNGSLNVLKVTEHVFNDKWQKQLVCVFRFKGIN